MLERLRGVPTEAPGGLKESNTPITPEFVVFCKAVPQLWASCLAGLGLSFSEYRILDAVTSADGPVRSTDVARALMLDRSVVSLFKDSVVERGLVDFSPAEGDRRNYVLALTEEGRGLVGRARAALQAVTDDAYSLCSDELVGRVNVWHRRMFRNMNVLNAVI